MAESAARQDPVTPQRAAILTLAIAVTVIIMALIGTAGPAFRVTEKYQTLSAGYDISQPSSESDPGYVKTIENMDTLNQFLIISVQPRHTNYDKDAHQSTWRFKVVFSARDSSQAKWKVLSNSVVEHDVHCSKGRESCREVTLVHEPFVEASEYRFEFSVLDPSDWTGNDADVLIVYADSTFTTHEIWWRFVFVAATLAVLAWFTNRIKVFRVSTWTLHQRWVFALLIALLGGNNPFFPLVVVVPGWFPGFLDILLQLSFFCFLLLFWLTALDALRRPESRTFAKFYLPKLGVVGTVWLSAIITSSWLEFSELDNPAQHDPTTMPGFIFLSWAMLLGMLFYLFWLAYILIRVWVESEHPAVLTKGADRVLFYYSFVQFIFIFVFIFISVQPQTNSGLFLASITMNNLYVYALAYVFAPTAEQTASKAAMGSHAALEEEEDPDDLTVH